MKILIMALALCSFNTYAAYDDIALYLSLKDSSGQKYHFACSATLISKSLLITAGHCFEKYDGKEVLPHKVYIYKKGRLIEKLFAGDFLVHHEYESGESFYKDIAWVKLKESAKSFTGKFVIDDKLKNRFHKPLFSLGYASKIPRLSTGHTVAVDEAMITDLGLSDSFDKYLMSSKLYPISRLGDSGAPVFAKKNGQLVLLGIIQFKGALFTKDESVTVTRIAPFMDWIKKTANYR